MPRHLAEADHPFGCDPVVRPSRHDGSRFGRSNRYKTKMRLTTCFVALVAVTSGCSGESTRYEDVSELNAALRAEDLGCEGLSRSEIEGKGKGIPTSSGSCAIAGEGIQLFVFDSEEDAELWFERGRMGAVSTARGTNWVVVTLSQGLADQIATALGGSS